MNDKEVHFSKTPVPITETDGGIVTDLNDLQYEKAFWPITETDVGIEIDIKEVQL